MDSEFSENTFPPFRFITMFTYRKRNVFIDGLVNSVICDAISFHTREKTVEIAGYVIVPDHVHIIVRPINMDIQAFTAGFKSYTGKKIKEQRDFSNKVWRRRFYDIEVADAADLTKRLDLMHTLPVRKNFSATPGEFLWSSWNDYNGKKGPADISIFTDF